MLQKMQLVRGVGITAALALTVVVSGCGGGKGTTNYAPYANFEFGQPNYQNTTANRGVFVPTGNSLNNPSSVATNGTKFYIADQGNNRVLGFNQLPTANTTTADFVIGQPNLTSNASGFGTGELSSPTKVSINGTRFLIVDNANNRVLIWNSLPVANTTPDIVLGGGLPTPVSASNLNTPYGATFAPSATFPNRVIVADTGNNRVLVYNNPVTGGAANYVLGQRDLSPGSMTVTAQNGSPVTATWTGNSANCPQLTPSNTNNCDINTFGVGADTLSGPADVWSDGAKLVIADTGNGRVLYFPTVPEQLVATAYTTANTGGPATFVLGQTNMITRTTSGGGSAGFTQPTGVWRDLGSGSIFVADTGNNRVLAFRIPTGNGIPAVAVYGQGDFTHVTANDDDQNSIADTNNGVPQASQRTLFAPAGSTTAGSQVYIPDAGNNRLMVFKIQ